MRTRLSSHVTPEEIALEPAQPKRPEPRICPCLGTGADEATALAYASDANLCYRSQRPHPISFGHQQSHCLTAGYRACPVFQDHKLVPPSVPTPGNAFAPDRAAAARRLAFFLVPLLIVLGVLGWMSRDTLASWEVGAGRVPPFLSLGQAVVLPTAVPTLPVFVPPATATASATPPEPSRTPRPAATATPSPTPTATVAASATASATPSATVTPTRCPQPVGWITYVVQAGDTLVELANARNTTAEAIVRLNCLSESALTPGQRIYLPPLLPTATPTPVPLPTLPILYPTSTPIFIPTATLVPIFPTLPPPTSPPPQPTSPPPTAPPPTAPPPTAPPPTAPPPTKTPIPPPTSLPPTSPPPTSAPPTSTPLPPPG